MSLQIVASGMSPPDATVDSVTHSVRAVHDALANAGLTVDDVDLLLNIGVYRHHNMCEPSVCALIQHELGMGLDARKFPRPRTVFSMDLNNGACGLISALAALAAVMPTRSLDHALIVGADCPPSGQPDPTFPFTPLGTALVISRTAEPGGLGPVWQHTSPEPLDGQRGACDVAARGTASRTTIDVVRSPDFLDRLLAFAVETVGRELDAAGVAREGLRLLCSEPGPEFAAALADGLGLGDHTSTWSELGDVHTSSVAAAWHRQPPAPGDRLLLVNAGGGLTVGAAVVAMAPHPHGG